MTERQCKQIKDKWHSEVANKREAEEDKKAREERYEEQHACMQQEAQEFEDIRKDVAKCDIHNIIHSAKLSRIADTHILRARRLQRRCKDEVAKIRKEQNSSKKDGVKNLSKAIGDRKASPLICIERDRDTADGGRKRGDNEQPQGHRWDSQASMDSHP